MASPAPSPVRAGTGKSKSCLLCYPLSLDCGPLKLDVTLHFCLFVTVFVSCVAAASSAVSNGTVYLIVHMCSKRNLMNVRL